jgi:hypothetical protein
MVQRRRILAACPWRGLYKVQEDSSDHPDRFPCDVFFLARTLIVQVRPGLLLLILVEDWRWSSPSTSARSRRRPRIFTRASQDLPCSALGPREISAGEPTAMEIDGRPGAGEVPRFGGAPSLALMDPKPNLRWTADLHERFVGDSSALLHTIWKPARIRAEISTQLFVLCSRDSGCSTSMTVAEAGHTWVPQPWSRQLEAGKWRPHPLPARSLAVAGKLRPHRLPARSLAVAGKWRSHPCRRAACSLAVS